MENTKVRFLRDVNLHITSDFNQEVKDKINSILRELFYAKTFEVNVDDFLHFLKIENLTRKAYIDFIDNDFKINFLSIGLNFVRNQDRKPIKINPRDVYKFNTPNYWFIAFSEYYDFVGEDETTITVNKSGTDVAYDIQELKNANITYDKFPH